MKRMIKKLPLVDLAVQYKSIKEEVLRGVVGVLSKGNFILGEELSDFEDSFAKYCGARSCIGVANGTDALLLSLRALGVGVGDEVITVANTFIATVLPIVYLGAKPVLVDIDPQTYEINTSGLEQAITKKTKVIIPVHLYGMPAPIVDIMRIAKRHKLFVLEDACQAHGSSITGKRCGSFGDVAAFSFYPGKNLGAAGDGGAIVTNSKRLADKVRIMRDVGQVKKYNHDIIGYNSRLDTLHAAILSVKLKRLDEWNKKRNQVANLYRKYLLDAPVVLPPVEPAGYVSNYHLFVIRTKKRPALLEFLKKNNVFGGIHYPIPVHLQKAMKSLGYKRGDFPITERYAKEILSLPMHPNLSGRDVIYISSLIKKFFSNSS